MPLATSAQRKNIASTGELLRKTSSVYNAFHLLSTTDADGLMTAYAYDKAGRQISQTTGDKKTTYEYDNLGRVYKTYEWLSDQAKVTVSLYDNLDRLIEERVEDLQGNVIHSSSSHYDKHGDLIRSQNGDAVTTTIYDGQGRARQITDALGNVTHITYDDKFVNRWNQVVLQQTETDPWATKRLPPSTLISAWLPSLNTISWEFSRFNKSSSTMPMATNSSPSIMSFCRQDDRQIITRKEYNRVDQIISQTEAVGTVEQKITRYAYNQYGELLSLTKPSGIVLHHTYDTLGRLQTFSSSDGTIDYDYTYNNSDQVTFAEDKVHHLNTLREYDALPTPHPRDIRKWHFAPIHPRCF